MDVDSFFSDKIKKKMMYWETMRLSLHQWFLLVQIALLGYGILYAKIGFSMVKVTLEFIMSFDMWTTNFWSVILGLQAWSLDK